MLYSAAGLFACRHCYGLAYANQRGQVFGYMTPLVIGQLVTTQFMLQYFVECCPLCHLNELENVVNPAGTRGRAVDFASPGAPL